MRNIYYLLAAFLIVVLLAAGCTQTSNAPSFEPTSQGYTKVPFSVKNYYSPVTGVELVYKIKLTGVDPMIHYYYLWPNGENVDIYEKNGRLLPPAKSDDCFLIIKIKSVEKSPKNLLQYEQTMRDFFKKFTDFIQLEIVRDDLDVFEHRGEESKEVFWARTYDENDPYSLIINQIVFYPPEARIPSEDRFSVRTIFTDSKAPAEEIEKTADILTLVGVEKLPGYGELPCIHFLRIVKERDKSKIGKAFTEDTWYAPGVGLVRLEQKVEGKTSMIWELQSSPV